MGVVCTKVDLLPQPDGTTDARVHLESATLLGSYFMVRDVQSIPDLGARVAEQIKILNTAQKGRE